MGCKGLVSSPPATGVTPFQQGIWLPDVKPFCSLPMFQEELTLAHRKTLLCPWLVGYPLWCSAGKWRHLAEDLQSVNLPWHVREALCCIYTAGAVTSPQVSAVSCYTSKAYIEQLLPRTCKPIYLSIQARRDFPLALWLMFDLYRIPKAAFIYNISCVTKKSMIWSYKSTKPWESLRKIQNTAFVSRT